MRISIIILINKIIIQVRIMLIRKRKIVLDAYMNQGRKGPQDFEGEIAQCRDYYLEPPIPRVHGKD